MTGVLGMRTPAEWEALYHQLGQIISAEPPVPMGDDRGSGELLRWLGRAEALIEAASGLAERFSFDRRKDKLLTATLQDGELHMRHIRSLLFTALAKAELNAPAASTGAFIPAGNAFDTITAIAGVLRECRGSILVVDPHMDAIALTDFLTMAPERIPLRLLASGKQKAAGLPEAVHRWKTQFGAARPIELRLAAPRLLHDRLIMDDASVWSLSQSFNAIAQRSPAMIQRVSADIAAAKREAFLDMWSNATPA